jgi:hypothetical protein
MDLMDVDSSLTSSSNSSFEKQIKDVLSQAQLTTLNDNMTEDAGWQTAEEDAVWQTAEGDGLRRLIRSVFLALTSLLGETAMKNNIVTTQAAREMVNSFSKDELKRWKVVVQNCVEKKDWVDLIRTCVFDY